MQQVRRQVPALPPLCSDLGQVPGARFVKKGRSYARTTQRVTFGSTMPFLSVGFRCQNTVKAAMHICLLRDAEIRDPWTAREILGGLCTRVLPRAGLTCKLGCSGPFPAQFWREDVKQHVSLSYALHSRGAQPGALPSLCKGTRLTAPRRSRGCCSVCLCRSPRGAGAAPSRSPRCSLPAPGRQQQGPGGGSGGQARPAEASRSAEEQRSAIEPMGS